MFNRKKIEEVKKLESNIKKLNQEIETIIQSRDISFKDYKEKIQQYKAEILSLKEQVREKDLQIEKKDLINEMLVKITEEDKRRFDKLMDFDYKSESEKKKLMEELETCENRIKYERLFEKK